MGEYLGCVCVGVYVCASQRCPRYPRCAPCAPCDRCHLNVLNVLSMCSCLSSSIWIILICCIKA